MLSNTVKLSRDSSIRINVLNEFAIETINIFKIFFGRGIERKKERNVKLSKIFPNEV